MGRNVPGELRCVCHRGGDTAGLQHQRAGRARPHCASPADQTRPAPARGWPANFLEGDKRLRCERERPRRRLEAGQRRRRHAGEAARAVADHALRTGPNKVPAHVRGGVFADRNDFVGATRRLFSAGRVPAVGKIRPSAFESSRYAGLRLQWVVGLNRSRGRRSGQ